WYPVVTIELQEEVVVSEDELLFTPFNAQLGIRPQGFIHFLRYYPYLASRLGRRLAAQVGNHEAYTVPSVRTLQRAFSLGLCRHFCAFSCAISTEARAIVPISL